MELLNILLVASTSDSIIKCRYLPDYHSCACGNSSYSQALPGEVR